VPFTPLTEPPDGTPDGPALVVAVHEGRSVFVVDDDAPTDGLFLGLLDGRWCVAVDVRDEPDVDLDLLVGRPAGAGQAVGQVVEIGLGNLDAEGADVLGAHGWHRTDH
jgi:hypothetical protein